VLVKSLALRIKNANPKLMRTVVSVKNKFSPACLNLLYLNLNNGTMPSIAQKKTIPLINNNERCHDWIC